MKDELNFLVEEGEVPVYNIRDRAFLFAKNVLLFVGETKYDRIYFSLFDQLVRSSTSVGANLAEGMAGVSKKDFFSYYAVALKSANETKYWLNLIKEINISNNKIINELITEADQISKIIAKIIINTKSSQ